MHIQELSYSVPDASNKKIKAHLLQGVSGFFEARQMAALVSRQCVGHRHVFPASLL